MQLGSELQRCHAAKNVPEEHPGNILVSDDYGFANWDQVHNVLD